MAKRFTDTDKWDRPWFRKLSPKHKSLWEFLRDKCDAIGVWYVDFEMASMCVGEAIDPKEALQAFEKQVQPFKEGTRWFIPSFVPFQYGLLKDNNNFHRSLIAKLSALDLVDGQPLTSPWQGAKEKERNGVSSFPKESLEEREPLGFSDFWSAYPKKRSRGQALKAWRNLKPSIEQVSRILAAIIRAKKSMEWVKDGGQFIPYPATWINAQGWEDVMTGLGIPIEVDPAREKAAEERIEAAKRRAEQEITSRQLANAGRKTQ